MLTKILLLGATLLAAACQTTGPAMNAAVLPAPGPAAPITASAAEPVGGGSERLFAHRWALTEAAGQPVTPTGDARDAHLLFFPPSRLGGSTGCNRLNGSFTLTDGGRMTFSPLATTRMMCPEPAATTEARFVRVLGTVQAYFVTDATLELRDSTAVVARFRASPASPAIPEK